MLMVGCHSFAISPGEDELMSFVSQNKNLPEEYQVFSAYPTAFVMAANIELSFTGATSK